MKPKVLLTGFKPFSIYPVNSSWEAVKLIKEHDNAVAIKELTVDHATAHVEIVSTLQAIRPEIALLSGLADQNFMALETTARKPLALSLIEGPDTLVGSWPWEKTAKSLTDAKTPFMVSANAGRYVCESVYWSALNFKNRYGYPELVGFVHVPLISRAWPKSAIAKSLQVILETARDSRSFD